MYSWKTVLVTIAVLFGLKIWNPFLVENMKWSWFDFLHQQHEIEEVQDIVLVDIDEKSWKNMVSIHGERCLSRHHVGILLHQHSCIHSTIQRT